jgi:hypothetical protein
MLWSIIDSCWHYVQPGLLCQWTGPRCALVAAQIGCATVISSLSRWLPTEIIPHRAGPCNICEITYADKAAKERAGKVGSESAMTARAMSLK